MLGIALSSKTYFLMFYSIFCFKKKSFQKQVVNFLIFLPVDPDLFLCEKIFKNLLVYL